jgi:adenine-specific DNA-methyltransferase
MYNLTNNDHMLKDRRRSLRARSTGVEHLLWRKLRGRQVQGLKFFRQFSVGPYILDFYCPHTRLAIELDGSQHATKHRVAYDQERTAYLEGKDIKVVRFWNNEVSTNIEGVMTRIYEFVSPNSSNSS